ncbi:MAG: sigma-54 dependent transcriptional regulator [Candidatus Cloacimonetes bacterium]|jgi:DNA-binding NtrC family response regulator|nr:sigma-54 dependent transcriptional regulator [Candidatus Cloacimonadota bacterium]
MEKFGKILIIDDNEDILFSLKLLLKNHVETIHTEINPDRIPGLMNSENFDVILLDMNFTRDMIGGQEGFYWLEKILEIDPSAVVVFITAYGDVERAVKAIKAGAVDFVLKPWQNAKLLATISSALKLRGSLIEANKLRLTRNELCKKLDQPFHDFIGDSAEMHKVFNTIMKVASTDASILILGENGTGKELVARALHRNSARRNDVFLSVDLGAISETLFESELFGHMKGSFTDAKKDKPGRLEIASGGTLFLDEIGNLSLTLQSKLLTALEKREVIRVGSNKPIPINVRLICATNMPIYQMAKEGKFRQDLLYRINTVEITLPLLSDRDDDIPLLVEHFLQQFTHKYKKNIKDISSSAIKKLRQYSWPGNVRELQHAVERAVILSESKILQPGDFMLKTHQSNGTEGTLGTYKIEDIERDVIQRAIRKSNGNISQAAKELGLTRASLYRRLEKYGL